jgi:hypothetical protein
MSGRRATRAHARGAIWSRPRTCANRDPTECGQTVYRTQTRLRIDTTSRRFRLDQLSPGAVHIGGYTAEETGGVGAGRGQVASGDGLPPDPLAAQFLLRVELVRADADHGLDDLLEAPPVEPIGPLRGGQQVGRQLAALDPHRQIDLLRRGQERHLPDLPEVHADGVGGGAGRLPGLGGRAGCAVGKRGGFLQALPTQWHTPISAVTMAGRG